MNIVKAIACLIVGHDTNESKSIVNTFCANNWLKQCKRCGAKYYYGADIWKDRKSGKEVKGDLWHKTQNR